MHREYRVRRHGIAFGFRRIFRLEFNAFKAGTELIGQSVETRLRHQRIAVKAEAQHCQVLVLQARLCRRQICRRDVDASATLGATRAHAQWQ